MSSRSVASIFAVLIASTVFATPAQAAPKRPWVKVSASSSSITGGAVVTMSVKVGRHAPRQQVRVQRASGSRWVTLATRTLPRASKTRSLKFRVTVTQVGRQRLRVLLARKGSTRAVASRTIAVTVRRPPAPAPTSTPRPPAPTPPPPARLQTVPGGTGVDGIDLSADGRWVVYRKVHLVGDVAASDIFLVDMTTGAQVQVSTPVRGGGTDGWSFQSSISDDGNWVVYSSDATNLVDGDTNGQRDIFLWSRATRTTTLVTRAADGTPADSWSQAADVSSDGSVVVYSSNADSLVPGSTPRDEELFAWRRDTGVTTRISDGQSGPLGADFSDLGVSADGSTAVFVSRSAGVRSIHLRSLTTGELTFVREGLSPVMSADGRHVAYLTAGDWGNVVEAWDAATDTTVRVSRRLDGGAPNDMVRQPSISADGRWITFETAADEMTEDDLNGRRDVFLWDRATERSALVSAPTAEKPATEEARDAVVSADGAYVIFQSQEPFAVVGKAATLYRWARVER